MRRCRTSAVGPGWQTGSGRRIADKVRTTPSLGSRCAACHAPQYVVDQRGRLERRQEGGRLSVASGSSLAQRDEQGLGAVGRNAA